MTCQGSSDLLSSISPSVRSEEFRVRLPLADGSSTGGVGQTATVHVCPSLVGTQLHFTDTLELGFWMRALGGGWQHPHEGLRVPVFFFLHRAGGGGIFRKNISIFRKSVRAVHAPLVDSNCCQWSARCSCVIVSRCTDTLLFQALKTGCCVFRWTLTQHQCVAADIPPHWCPFL